MAKNKFLTLDDLFQFCSNNNMQSFDAKEHDNSPIVVQTFGTIDTGETTDNGLLPVLLKCCHSGENNNHSYISDEVMQKALPTLANKPILAEIKQMPDGTYDFTYHSMEKDEDDNIIYIERPIGVIPESCNPKLEYDEENDKTYVIANGYLYEEYGNMACDILREKGSTKMSVEISVFSMEYDAKNKYLKLNDICFNGITALGRDPNTGMEIHEGMEGSNMTIADFSAENNSVFSAKDMMDMMGELKSALAVFNAQKGGNEMHFEELLQKYNVTAEDITFEIKGMSDEELDAKFAEMFEETGTGETGTGETGTGEDDTGTGEDDAVVVPEDDEETKKKVYVRTYELSHEDIRYSLYMLLDASEDENVRYAWIENVYDDKFIYACKKKYYLQKYSKTEEDTIAFDGDPIEVFAEFITESEKSALEEMRKNYKSLKAFKENVEHEQEKFAKEQILNSEAFASISDDERFKELVNDMDKYSVSEIETQAKLIYADSKIKFESVNNDEKQKKSTKVSFSYEKEKTKPYGSLFANKH